MRGVANTIAGTEHAHHASGFPPFRTETFPSQLFWLAITFGFLFLVLWRFSGPMIADTIAARRKKIGDDIAEAQKARSNADVASVAYEKVLADARASARATAEERRKIIAREWETARALADKDAQAALAGAERQILQAREAARTHLREAAEEATSSIVHRLIGKTLSTAEVREAVRAAGAAATP